MAERIISRRDFLQSSSAGVAGAVLLSACAGDFTDEQLASAALAARADFGVSVFAFPLSGVTLLDGAGKKNNALRLDGTSGYARLPRVSSATWETSPSRSG